MMGDYAEFLKGKATSDEATGLSDIPELNPMLYDFQRDIVRWALRRGRAAIFADCGLGKTPMQLEWAQHLPGDVLIVAPLAVSKQTIREGDKFGVDVAHSQDGNKAGRITITNYERLHHFNPDDFVGIVLDESSILKSYTGKFRTELIERWGSRPFRLACTATPAPNDYMELGNHSQFIGAMRGSEMLSSFFINDAANVGRYRVKGHAEGPFWEWMASWAVMMRNPSDLGYNHEEFTLPPLTVHDVIVDANQAPEGMLFSFDAHTMSERRAARKASIKDRVSIVANMVNRSTESWLVWCDLNAESEMLKQSIPDAIEVRGSDSEEHKDRALLGFADNDFRVLVSKPSIAGWGMNYQHCHKVAFTGLSDSYESFYQAVRRAWRFGQINPVDCYVITDRTEGAVVANIRKKKHHADRMATNMAARMSHISKGIVRGDKPFTQAYQTTNQMEVPAWLSA
jgi:hypothetical protein